MFKNKLDASKQLAEKINRDEIKPTKIIGLTEPGKKLGQALIKLLSVPKQPTRPKLRSVAGKPTIIIADDGGTAVEKLIHAVKLFRKKNAKKIIVALPVYKHEDVLELEKHADAVYTVQEPETFISPEEFYTSMQ